MVSAEPSTGQHHGQPQSQHQTRAEASPKATPTTRTRVRSCPLAGAPAEPAKKYPLRARRAQRVICCTRAGPTAHIKVPTWVTGAQGSPLKPQHRPSPRRRLGAARNISEDFAAMRGECRSCTPLRPTPGGPPKLDLHAGPTGREARRAAVRPRAAAEPQPALAHVALDGALAPQPGELRGAQAQPPRTRVRACMRAHTRTHACAIMRHASVPLWAR